MCVKSYRVTIHLKATEQHFPVVLFIILYKVFHIFASVNKMGFYNLELRIHYYSYCLWTISILPQSDFACKTGSLLYRIALWECFRNAISSLMRLALGSIHRLIEARFFFSKIT